MRMKEIVIVVLLLVAVAIVGYIFWSKPLLIMSEEEMIYQVERMSNEKQD